MSVSAADSARSEMPALVASMVLAFERLDAGDLDLEEVFVELVGGGAG